MNSSGITGNIRPLQCVMPILCAVAIVGCSSYPPSDEIHTTRASGNQDSIACRTQADAEGHGVSGPLAMMIAGALYGAIHGAAATSSGEGALFGAAAGAGVGLVIGISASITKYNETFDRCMESRRHQATHGLLPDSWAVFGGEGRFSETLIGKMRQRPKHASDY